MDRLKEYTRAITDLTQKIEEEYPELYQYLDETPPTLPNDNDPEMDIKAMNNYLEGLKSVLQHYIEMHEKGASPASEKKEKKD